MTHELGPTSRALLAAARDGLGPDDDTASRVRARVAAAIAGGVAAGIGAGQGVSSAAAATTSASAGTTIATAGTTTATAGTTTAIAGTTSATATTTTAAGTIAGAAVKLKLALAALALAGSATAVTTVLTRATAPTTPPELSLPAAAPLDDEPHARIRVTSSESAPAIAQPSDADAAPAVPHPASITLTREVALVDLAMARLRDHDYRAALDAIHLYDRESAGRGQLAEDAAAIQIESRCGLHESVSTALDAFDARWPSSAQRARLTAACSH